MRRKILCSFLIGGIVADFNTLADVTENPYHAILARNPFGLKPIPEVLRTVEKEPPQVDVEIKLTGIGNLTGTPKAFIELHDKKANKKEIPPALMAGDKYADIEILEIDTSNYTVRIRRSGVETTLDFEQNGIRPDNPASTVRGPTQTPGVPKINLTTTPQTTPSLRDSVVLAQLPPSEKVLVGGEGKLSASSPRSLTLEEARAVITLRRQEMERTQPGSSIILPPTGNTLEQSRQFQTDSETRSSIWLRRH